VPEAARAAAGASLSRVGVEVAPRAQWPSGMERLGVPVKGRIPADEQVGRGRAVARLTDLGWGTRLRALLAEGAPDGPADPALLAACVDVLKGWRWERRPVAVATVPSRSRPALVHSVGEHLAGLGRLAWLGPLATAGDGPRGRPGGNSAFRLAGLWEAFTPTPEQVRALAGLDGPVLLVDDLADSRWTVTVAGRALRRAGAPEVLPFVLAVPA
jgi:ATP-dependent DNA helicase RecQ